MGIPLRIFGPKRLSYINTMTDVAPKSKSAVKSKAPASHPKYMEMVSAAINQIGGPRGASRQAILKYVCENYKVEPAKAAVQVKLCLKNGFEKGKLKMARESGKGAGGFKLVKEEKPKKVSKPKATTPKKKPAAKSSKPSKKVPVKSPAKKMGVKKATKSPGKVKKTAAKSPAAKKVVKKTGKSVGKSPAKKAPKAKAAPKTAAKKA